ncbi:MAG: NnrS family protein [Rubrivivax sp.]
MSRTEIQAGLKTSRPSQSTAQPAAAAAPSPPARGPAGLRLGFRPFYLAAALLACVEVPLWVAFNLGALDLPSTLPPMLWHAHEMLFGFAAAVIVGFLLTAGKAWTGRSTPHGASLGALVLLWAAARLTTFGAPYAVHAALDIALLPLVAAVLGRVLLQAGNRRNLVLVLLLALLTTANVVFHLAVAGVLAISALTPLHAALALVVMIECVIAGRIVPAFTQSVTPGLKLRASAALDGATLAATAVALLLWVFAAPGWPGALAFGVAGALHLRRQAGWHPWATRRRPILWILHAGYAWIAIGCGLLALAQLGLVGCSAGIHALAVGATGGLVIGMITRTARGHTGRPLQASRSEVLAYALVLLAAGLRVVWPLMPAALQPIVLVAAATCWSVAFLVYLIVFAPWLTAPRLDGKDG